MVKHHTLAQQIGKRFVKLDQPKIAHRLRPETCVQKMQHRMRDAADVLIHRHPVIVARRHHLVVIVRRGVGRGVAHVIPRRIDKSIHRVGFAFGRLAAFGTGAVDETRVCLERISGAIGYQVQRQHDGQVFFGNRYVATIGAVDDGDRRTPIALAGNAPIAEAVLDFLFRYCSQMQEVNYLINSLIIVEAIEIRAGVDQEPG